jgi:hypothetical protein
MEPDRQAALRNAYRGGRVATGNRAHVLVASMPKSGSSLLVRMVAELPGFRRVVLVRGHDRRENELALELLVEHHDADWVARAHVRHSATTARMIRTFGLVPVVQTRDLADTVVSLHDHLQAIADVNPIAYVPEAFAEWPRDRRLEFVVDTFVPWYLHLVLSWSEVPGVVHIGYHQLMRAPGEQLHRIVETAGIAAGATSVDDACRRALAAELPTRNTVVEGRGRDLPPVARRRLERLAGYYAGHDLSAVGL